MEPFEELEHFEKLIIEKINKELLLNGGNINENIFEKIKKLSKQSIQIIRDYIDDNKLDINYLQNYKNFLDKYLVNENDSKIKIKHLTNYFKKIFNYHLNIYYLIYPEYIRDLLFDPEWDSFINEIQDYSNTNFTLIILILLIVLKNNNIIYCNNISIFDEILKNNIFEILTSDKQFSKLNYLKYLKIIFNGIDLNNDILIEEFIRSSDWFLSEYIENTLEDLPQINDDIIIRININLLYYFNKVFDFTLKRLNFNNKKKILKELKDSFKNSNYKNLIHINEIVNIYEAEINWKYKSPLLLVWYFKNKNSQNSKYSLDELPHEMIREIIKYL